MSAYLGEMALRMLMGMLDQLSTALDDLGKYDDADEIRRHRREIREIARRALNLD